MLRWLAELIACQKTILSRLEALVGQLRTANEPIEFVSR
jgi:hypothetical protein